MIKKLLSNIPKIHTRIPIWAWSLFFFLAVFGGLYQLTQRYTDVTRAASVSSFTVAVKENIFKVLESRQFYLRVLNVDGNIEMRTGGNITWRTNNPAKIMWSPWAEKQGAHQPGKDQSVAIFPTEELGQRANYILLFESRAYSHLTLADAIKKYSPADKGYNPARYLEFLKAETNINQDKVLSSLDEEDRLRILDAIKKYEGWTEGRQIIFKNEKEWKEFGW